jgi:ribonuclease G
MLEKQLIINTNQVETRIALLERENLAELFVERHHERAMVGNIVKAKVNRVLPGMQAAFLDIGADRSAFLYAGDVLNPDEKNPTEDIVGPAGENPIPDEEDFGRLKRSNRAPIEKVLTEGQQILVQISKEPLGSKGARATMHISLPGRYLVLVPGDNRTGISKRIVDEKERQRLIQIIQKIKPTNVGIIVRTAAEGADDRSLAKDLRYLVRSWQRIQLRAPRESAPVILYQDLDLARKVARDLFGPGVEKIVVDDRGSFEDLKRFLNATTPEASKKLELHTAEIPVFDLYGIEMDIGRALGRKIDLPSGGHLVIDQTEALTSFDVNTGKFVGHKSARDTILRTNIEAIAQIVRQIRVRNIGGIIVIDFIDMEREDDREKVYLALQEELTKDKARSTVLRISELGLVQMTRKRTAESLERQLTEPCPCCDGKGRIRSTQTEAYDLIREITRLSIQSGRKDLRIRVRDDVRDWLLHEENVFFDSVLTSRGIKVAIESMQVSRADLGQPAFEVFPG